MSTKNEAIYERVVEELANRNANIQTLELWKQVWDDLSGFCDIADGEQPDDYTLDLVLCWSGWVLDGDDDASNLIYSSINDFNLSIKESAVGQAATKALYNGIDRHASDPASVYRELAKDQLERISADDKKKKNTKTAA